MKLDYTFPCPRCGADATLYSYSHTRKRLYYCPRSRGCGASGSVTNSGNTRTDVQTCTECGRVNTANNTRDQAWTCRDCRALTKVFPIEVKSCALQDCQRLYTWHEGRRPADYCTAACRRLARRRRTEYGSELPRRGKATREQRLHIAFRHGYRCHLCGKVIDVSIKAPHPQALAIDHLIPHSDGGSYDPINLAPSHQQCNSRRGRIGPAQLQAFS